MGEPFCIPVCVCVCPNWIIEGGNDGKMMTIMPHYEWGLHPQHTHETQSVSGILIQTPGPHTKVGHRDINVAFTADYKNNQLHS